MLCARALAEDYPLSGRYLGSDDSFVGGIIAAIGVGCALTIFLTCCCYCHRCCCFKAKISQVQTVKTNVD